MASKTVIRPIVNWMPLKIFADRAFARVLDQFILSVNFIGRLKKKRFDVTEHSVKQKPEKASTLAGYSA